MKRIDKYFVCDKCGIETDTGYEVIRKGKRIMVCETCYRKTKKEQKKCT